MASPKRGGRGRTGARGKSGLRGKTGFTGKTGLTGKTGPRGPAMKRSHVLAIVADQFEEVRKQLDLQRKQLDLQLQRTAQIQAQLDHLANLIKPLVMDDSRSERSFEDEHGLR